MCGTFHRTTAAESKQESARALMNQQQAESQLRSDSACKQIHRWALSRRAAWLCRAPDRADRGAVYRVVCVVWWRGPRKGAARAPEAALYDPALGRDGLVELQDAPPRSGPRPCAGVPAHLANSTQICRLREIHATRRVSSSLAGMLAMRWAMLRCSSWEIDKYRSNESECHRPKARMVWAGIPRNDSDVAPPARMLCVDHLGRDVS